MLEELRIDSLGVIDESVLELGPGFTALTGETGAGKTMVVTALGLLLGGRADSGAVRTGASRARVEGVLHVDTLAPEARTELAELLEEAGAETEDGRLLLARQVSAEGRSRGYAGGAGVPATTLGRLGDSLVAVHGQSDQHRLLRAAAQRDALDRFAGDGALSLRSRFGELHEALRTTVAELGEVVATARERAREADLLRFGLGEIEAVSPVPGEDVALAAEESRLGFADTLRTAAEQARAALSSDDGSPDALGAVAAARRLLDGVRDHDPQAAELGDRLAELSYLLSDLAADVSSYASGLDTDPARLGAVSERRAALGALTRKYGATVDEVLAWAADSAQRVLDLDDTDTVIERLAARRDALLDQLAEVGHALTVARETAATALAEAVTAELHALAMPHARVAVAVTQTPVAQTRSPDDASAPAVTVGGRLLRMTTTGLDEVELLLAANVGSEPRPLAKGASGGELSRVMLALEVALADTDPVPTFVFDEVDAGVGGKAAVEVGRRLAMLARTAQVLVVTHLPQVAAFADRHVLVAKSQDGRVTTSGLKVLDDEARVRELSRMLAGLEDSATARAHAEELLAAARSDAASDPVSDAASDPVSDPVPTTASGTRARGRAGGRAGGRQGGRPGGTPTSG
ncbi:MAG: repair protein RecN [Nocardioidaceae bacterium]|nr:repair protein RecN [Nocardioidaceae bacterium]